MKFLIIHTYGLGDMIMFTPALQKLIESYPEAKIDFLIFQKVSAEPIKRNNNVNNIYYSDFNLKSILKTIFKLRKEKYDFILTTSGTSPIKAGIFNLFLKGKIKVGEYKKSYERIFFDKKVKYIEDIHRVENNFNIINSICKRKIDTEIFKTKFYGIDYIRKGKTDFDNIKIGIHPGSNKKYKAKRWKKENFVKLINLLKENFSNLEFFIFGGPDEIEEAQFIAQSTKSHIVQDNLFNVAKEISTCDIFINTDSGLGHIASCFEDIEIFTIFGPAKEYKTAPFSKKANTISLNIDCRPCYGTDRLKKCKTFDCLNNLTPEFVFSEIIKKSEILRKVKNE